MPPGRALVPAALLSALSFALGAVYASRQDGGAIDTAESRTRIRSAAAASDQLEQAALVAPFFAAMQPDSVDALAQVFEAGFPKSGSGLPLELFVEGWARFDPQAARDRILSWPADVQRQAWPALIRSWARAQPAAARETLAQIPDASVRRLLIGALVEGWSESGEPGLWQYLSALPDPERRREFSALAVQTRLWRGGAENLLRELEALPDEAPPERFQGELLALAAEQVARVDLPRALALAEAQRGHSQGGEILRRVATAWAESDGLAALTWLRAQPAGPQRDVALRSAYRRWLQREREAASAWLAQGIGDSDLAPAAIAHASALAQQDPEAAAAWTGGIPDPDLRRLALLEIERTQAPRQRAIEAARRLSHGAPEPEGSAPPAPPPARE